MAKRLFRETAIGNIFRENGSTERLDDAVAASPVRYPFLFGKLDRCHRLSDMGVLRKLALSDPMEEFMPLDWVWNLTGEDLQVSVAIAQWLTVPVGIVALALAAWAAKAAARSAEIARAALAVTEQTAEYQLRAYVHHGRATVLSMTNSSPVIEVEIVNSGQTPAYDVEVGTRHYLGRPQARIDLQGGGTRTRILGTIGPSHRRCIKVEHIDPLPMANTKPFVLSVVVRWKDIYGKDREDSVSFSCSGLLDGSPSPMDMMVVTDRSSKLDLPHRPPGGPG